MNNKLTVLVYPFESLGHINFFIGLTQSLLRLRHKVIFIVSPSSAGKLSDHGFEEEVIDRTIYSNETSGKRNPGEFAATHISEMGLLSSLPSIEKIKIILKDNYFSKMVNSLTLIEPQIKFILDKQNPDIILLDQFIYCPTLVYSGKPWVNVFTFCPIGIEDDKTPPIGSGYPTDSDPKDWFEFKQLLQKYFAINEYNEYLSANGFQTLDNNKSLPESPFLNVYGFPKELDYTDIRPVPDKWFGVENFIRKVEEPFELPVQLKGWEGKLIYLSLGTLGSINIELMKRLVNILSKSKHKFIVSKGLFGDKYELADNMWGQRSVPQTKVLPLVDLVLTHGGNNTVTESLYFGKPMIVLPLFWDQFDNAQRIDEKGFGVRLDPYLCSEEELLNSIEMLLKDKELNERLSLVSKRIQTSDSLEKMTKRIESLAIKHKY